MEIVSRFNPFSSVLIVLLLLSALNLNAQNERCYAYLSFEDFFNQKVENDTNFIREVYRSLKYPTPARIIEAEAKIELLLINHNNNELELIQVTPSQHFSSVVESLRQTFFSSVQFNKDEPFLTKFYLYFDLDPFRKFPNQKQENKIIGLINNNMFIIKTYLVPLIESEY